MGPSRRGQGKGQEAWDLGTGGRGLLWGLVGEKGKGKVADELKKVGERSQRELGRFLLWTEEESG